MMDFHLGQASITREMEAKLTTEKDKATKVSLLSAPKCTEYVVNLGPRQKHVYDINS